MNKTNTYEIWHKNDDGVLTVQERNGNSFVWTDEVEAYEAAATMARKWPACTLVVVRAETQWPSSECKRTVILRVGRGITEGRLV